MSDFLAPNGKPSKLTPEQYKLVRSQSFKAWFGDWENLILTKINDSGIDEISLKRLEDGVSKIIDNNGEPLPVYHGTSAEPFVVFDGGSFFTDDYMNADGYASGEMVYEVFLNIKKPLIINAEGRKWDNLENEYGSSTRDIVGQLDFEKYDGVIFNNINDNWFDDEMGDTQNVYFSINPEQIKLADGTNTTFDGNNPDIRFDDGGYIKKVKFDIDEDEDGDRTIISIKNIGEVILVATFPEYEFLEDIGEDGLEELEVEEGTMIGKIEHLEIDDKFKGKGYATLLMEKAIEVAKEKGLMPLYLNASPMGSKRYGLNIEDLTGFYEGLGFEVFLRQGGNNLMILKDTYEKGGETKNKIMEKQMEIKFDDNYAEGGVTYSEFLKDDYWQEQFDAWMQDGNVSKKADGTYSTQDAQYTNSLRGMSALKRYFYKEFIKGQHDSYAGGGKLKKKTKINKKYKYFAQHKENKKIFDGWEIIDDVETTKHFAKLDLKDKDFNPSDFSVISANFLLRKGIDPYDSDNWYKIQYEGGGSLDDKHLVAKAIEYITGTLVQEDTIQFEASQISFKYKNTNTWTSISKKLIEDTIRMHGKSLKGRFEKGGEAGFNDEGTDMIMYHEKKGNFIIPKGQIYLWLYEGEKIGEKLQNEQYDWVFYPLTSNIGAFQSGYIPPLKRVWTKKFQKEHKGSEHLLGLIKAYLIEKEGEKELFIDMMSVNPTKMKQGIMSYMIKDLRDAFNLSQDQVTFSKLTKEGEKFIAKKTYADGGITIDEIDAKKKVLVDEVDKLIPVHKKKYGNMPIDSPKSKEEKESGKKISSLFSEINELIILKRKLLKEQVKFADGGEIYVHKYNPNITLEFIENTNKGIKGLQKNPKSLSKKERNEGIIVNYSDSEIKELFNKKFASGGDVPHEDKMFQLPLEMVVYVPSTQDVDKVISVDEMDSRVDEVKQYLASKFGGYSATDKLGGFVDSTGSLINEDVVQVTSFSTKEAYNEHKEELIQQLAKWGKQWEQEAIGFEFEGDLMYVPQELDSTKYVGGGAIYPDLSLQKADVVNDSVVLDEFEIKKTKNKFQINGLENLKITKSDDAVKILRELFEKDTISAYEQAVVLYLNKNNKVIGYYNHSSGGIDGTIMDVEMISGMALKSLSKGVIIAHNHPSENTMPSDADKRITKQLNEALKLFNIQLLDSLILTENSYLSFQEVGLI